MAKFSIEFQTKGAQQVLQDFANMDKAQQKAVLSSLQLDQSQAKAERSMKRAAKTGQVEFRDLATQITGISSGFDLASRAAGVLLDKLREIREERRRSEQLGRSAAQVEADLNQLAAGDPKRKAELEAIRARLQTSTGITREKAGALTFTAASTGFDSAADIQTLIDLQRTLGTQGDAQPLVDAAASLRAALGQDEVGSLREQLIKLQTAGNISQKNPTAIAAQALRAAPGAALAGISDEELQAAIAATIGGLGESTGTGINAFSRFLVTNKDFQGKSLQEATREIQSRNLSGDQLLKLLGSTEALAGFNALSNNLDTIASNEAEIRAKAALTGTQDDLFDTTNSTRSRLQKLDEERAIAEQKKEIAQVEVQANAELRRQAEEDRRKATEISDDQTIVERVGASLGRGTAEFFGADADLIGGFETGGKVTILGLLSGLAVSVIAIEKLVDVLNRFVESNDDDRQRRGAPPVGVSGGAP